MTTYNAKSGAEAEILKKEGALCRLLWMAGGNILGFRWSKKFRIMLETISFWQNISISFSQIFSIFINKVLSVFQILLTRR